MLRAWELLMEGWTTASVREVMAAEGFGEFADSTIRGWAKQVARGMDSRDSDRITFEKGRQVGAHEHIYREAMAAWERSKGPLRRFGEKVVDKGDDDGHTESTETTAESHGQTAYLRTAMDALKAITKVTGLDAYIAEKARLKAQEPDVDPEEAKIDAAIAAMSAQEAASIESFFSRITGRDSPEVAEPHGVRRR